MKKIIFLFISLILISTAFSTFAMSSRLNDAADLLTSSEEAEILDLLDSISSETNFDLVIVTINDTEGKSVRDYADDYYDYNGYNEDGILYLIDMDNREWWISTSGEAINKFSDITLDYIGEEAAWYLGEGNYSQAFKTFISLSESYINMESDYNYNDDFNYGYDYDDSFYDDDYYEDESEYSFGTTLVISLIAGFIIALICVSSMKAKLITVGAQQNASNYTVNNSLQIAATSDNFLYRRISRVPRPKSNSPSHSRSSTGGHSVHRSSSGRSHGGRGGRF